MDKKKGRYFYELAAMEGMYMQGSILVLWRERMAILIEHEALYTCSKGRGQAIFG